MSETSGEGSLVGQSGQVGSNFDSAQISAKTINYVFRSELAIRFGRQVSGGAGYCLSDVFVENAPLSGAETAAVKTQIAMANKPNDAAWATWKARLWNCCAFGQSLGSEGGSVFLIAGKTALPGGDRYRPGKNADALWKVWKTPSGVSGTFVKTNLVPEGTDVLATFTYGAGNLSKEAVDALYGAIVAKLTELANQG